MPEVGDIAINKRTGARATFDGTSWVGQGGKALQQDASMRSRMDLGLGPMVQAQEDMSAIEKKSNPFSLKDNPDNAAAKLMTDAGIDVPAWGIQFHPLDGVAKQLGGHDFQAYQQASKAFESQLMPIMSGAAVSPSEAARQIKAALPELGDSPETLALKSRTRQAMLNGAAKARQLPLPYPDVPTWGVNTQKLPPSGTGGQSAGSKVRVYDPATGTIR